MENPAQSVFVITDALCQPDSETPKDRYVTGFWDGQELVSSVKQAKFYGSLSNAEKVVRKGSFYDPAIREYEYNGDYEDDADCMTSGTFFDMSKYGTA